MMAFDPIVELGHIHSFSIIHNAAHRIGSGAGAEGPSVGAGVRQLTANQLLGELDCIIRVETRSTQYARAMPRPLAR